MASFALSDVDPFAIAICKKGANRQTIFLRKSHPDPTVQLPAATPMRKADGDWSVFYCTVAEPGAVENGGLLAPDDEDVWASADEIRKAAHRLLKNGAATNLDHDGDGGSAGSIVESAVALADTPVVDPTGTARVIKSGSWYVAIEPNADLREQIEKGEVTGVSLEGTGVRTPLEKAADKDSPGTHRTCKGCGGKMGATAKTCQNCGAAWVAKGQANASPSDRKKLKGLIEFYMKKPHPFRACVKDNTKRFGKGGAEKVCATLKDIGEGTTHWRKGGKGKVAKADVVDTYVDALVAAGVDNGEAIDLLRDYMTQEAEAHADGRGALAKMWSAVMGTEPVPAALVKTTDFSERVAERELQDASWRAFDTLQSVIYDAVRDDDEPDAAGVIRASIEQFSEYLLGKLDTGGRAALAKELATVGDRPPGQEDDDVDAAEVKQIVGEETAALKKSQDDTLTAVNALSSAVTALTEKVAGTATKDDDADKATTIEKAVEKLGQVADQVDGLDAQLTTLAKSIEDLGASSSQDDRDTVRKSDKSPLAGLLS